MDRHEAKNLVVEFADEVRGLDDDPRCAEVLASWGEVFVLVREFRAAYGVEAEIDALEKEAIAACAPDAPAISAQIKIADLYELLGHYPGDGIYPEEEE